MLLSKSLEMYGFRNMFESGGNGLPFRELKLERRTARRDHTHILDKQAIDQRETAKNN